jgi:transcriptional regulator with XRE-family HTH domain
MSGTLDKDSRYVLVMPDVSDEKRRSMLRTFLRAARENVRPEDHQLPARHRRRTPGLRREEVAELAGVSTAWYTLLETAGNRRVSVRTLERVAKALMLSKEDRAHLFSLVFPELPGRPLATVDFTMKIAEMQQLQAFVRRLRESKSVYAMIGLTVDFIWTHIATCDLVAFLEWDESSRSYRCARSRTSSRASSSLIEERYQLGPDALLAIERKAIFTEYGPFSNTFVREQLQHGSGRFLGAGISTPTCKGALLYADGSSEPHHVHEREQLTLVTDLLELAIMQMLLRTSKARSA